MDSKKCKKIIKIFAVLNKSVIFANEIKTRCDMKYTTRTINRNFKIKVYGLGLNKLVGVMGFREAVGDDTLCNRLLDRAFNSMDDKQVCKLRRGIKITFYWC